MNKLFGYKIIFMTLLLASLTPSISALDRIHFYSTNPLWPEPRFEKDHLFSLDILFYEGSAKKGRRKCDDCQTNLLDIYGTYNMRLLGKNVPKKDFSTFPDIILTLLSQIPSCCNDFGRLSFCGSFDTKQAEIMLTQNFKNGLFCLLHLPIRSLDIDCITYRDLSPTGPNTPNKDNPIWKAFLASFGTILKQYDLDMGPYKCTHIGDVSAMLGWTMNYEATEVVDFVDMTVKAGALFPSGKKRDPDKVFSLPHGYDGHFGLPFAFDIAVGFYEWLTVELHVDALVLFKHTRCLRMKTACEQSGMIKLAKGRATVDPGLIVQAGGYVQADHVVRGLSLTVGYSFSHRGDDKVCPCDTETFNTFIASSDEMFKRWKRHTLHFKAEYDFTKEDSRFGPRIGLFYNWHLKGERTFKTNTVGASFGLDITLKL